MVRYDQFKSKASASFNFVAVEGSQGFPHASLPSIDDKPPGSLSLRLAITEEDEDAAISFLLQKRPLQATRNPLTIKKNLASYGHARTWASINAGYGQLFNQPERLERWNGAGWEEPSCGYLKISFSF